MTYLILICTFFLSREKETKTLKEQIDKLQSQIQKEEAKAADLKMKAK